MIPTATSQPLPIRLRGVGSDHPLPRIEAITRRSRFSPPSVLDGSRTRPVLDSVLRPSLFLPSSARHVSILSAMEAVQGVRFVRLQCCVRRGAYLAADEDRTRVCLRAGHGAASSTVWSVEAATGAKGEAGFLLRGAYDHYLVASNLPAPAATGPPGAVIAQQRAIAHDAPPPLHFLWKIVTKGDGLIIQDLRERFLRANGKHLRWRRAITIASDSGSSMQRWSVEFLLEPEPLANPGDLRIQLDAVKSLLKEKKELLSSIRSERDELIGEERELVVKMAATQRKILALTSKAEKKKKRENPQVLPFALGRAHISLEITNRAKLAYESKVADTRRRICELNSQEGDIKKEIEDLTGTKKKLKSQSQHW